MLMASEAQVSGPHVLQSRMANCPLHPFTDKTRRGNKVLFVARQTGEVLFPVDVTPCCSEEHAKRFAESTA